VPRHTDTETESYQFSGENRMVMTSAAGHALAADIFASAIELRLVMYSMGKAADPINETRPTVHDFRRPDPTGPIPDGEG
jgi:hypothetical protein